MEASDLPLFCQRLQKLPRYRNLGPGEAETFLHNPNYFGAMMVQYGQVDGLVARRARGGQQLLASAFSARQTAAESPSFPAA